MARWTQADERTIGIGAVVGLRRYPVKSMGDEELCAVALSTLLADTDGRKEPSAIMAQTDHKSADMVRHCIRDGDLFRDNAADLGL